MAGLIQPNKWYHVAMTLDNNQGDGNGKVVLLVNGKVVAQGVAPTPDAGEKENLRDDCGLFVVPNVELLQVTEIRVWALARPQHDIDATKDWTLKMAKKARGGKKRGASIFKGVKIKKLSSVVARQDAAAGGTKDFTMSPSSLSLAAPVVVPRGIGGPPPSGGGRRRNIKKTDNIEKTKEVKKKKKKKKKKRDEKEQDEK